MNVNIKSGLLFYIALYNFNFLVGILHNWLWPENTEFIKLEITISMTEVQQIKKLE